MRTIPNAHDRSMTAYLADEPHLQRTGASQEVKKIKQTMRAPHSVNQEKVPASSRVEKIRSALLLLFILFLLMAFGSSQSPFPAAPSAGEYWAGLEPMIVQVFISIY